MQCSQRWIEWFSCNRGLDWMDSLLEKLFWVWVRNLLPFRILNRLAKAKGKGTGGRANGFASQVQQQAPCQSLSSLRDWSKVQRLHDSSYWRWKYHWVKLQTPAEYPWVVLIEYHRALIAVVGNLLKVTMHHWFLQAVCFRSSITHCSVPCWKPYSPGLPRSSRAMTVIQWIIL